MIAPVIIYNSTSNRNNDLCIASAAEAQDLTSIWTISHESGYWLRLNANAGVPSRLPPMSALALNDTPD
eukprot:scaffold69964_cov27-Prasinocladus_malaysianus.AAC.1